MAVTWDTFERYRQKGLDARRAGQWESARIYLVQAARAMLELSKDAQGEELRNARRETAQKLLELARDSDQAKREKRTQPARSGRPETAAGEKEGGPSADQWIVKEKPKLRFDDVAGL